MFRHKIIVEQNEELLLCRQLEPDLVLSANAEEIEYACPACDKILRSDVRCSCSAVVPMPTGARQGFTFSHPCALLVVWIICHVLG